MIQIANVDPAKLTITLKAAPKPLTSIDAFPDGVNPARRPKIRRWDGQGNMETGLLLVEAGILVSFDGMNAPCRTGDYWQIPARAATAASASGDIEWPRELNPATSEPDPTKPRSLLPRGITHHYCRLGFIVMNPAVGATSSPIADAFGRSSPRRASNTSAATDRRRCPISPNPPFARNCLCR